MFTLKLQNTDEKIKEDRIKRKYIMRGLEDLILLKYYCSKQSVVNAKPNQKPTAFSRSGTINPKPKLSSKIKFLQGCQVYSMGKNIVFNKMVLKQLDNHM